MALERRQIVEDQPAVGVTVEIRLDQLRRGGDREIDGLAPQRQDRLLLFPLDVAPRPFQQLLLLLARLGQQLLALLLRHGLGAGEDVLGLGPRLGERLTVLLQEPGGLCVGLLRAGQLLRDARLALLDHPEQRGPPEPPQHRDQQTEDDQRPEHHPRVDAERGEFLSRFSRRLLQQQQQDGHHAISLKSSANTRAASPTPSTSAAVRIMAPRMSAEACGWRAIASTARPPIWPMPMPTPMTASPSPMPAPSSALVFLAAATVSEAAWSSSSVFTMSILEESGTGCDQCACCIIPMNTDVSSAKIYACRKATSSSSSIMNRTNATEPAATAQLVKMKIRPSNDRITKCPAVMLANNRRHSANGFTSFEMSSIGVMIPAMSTAPKPFMPGGTNTIVFR